MRLLDISTGISVAIFSPTGRTAVTVTKTRQH